MAKNASFLRYGDCRGVVRGVLRYDRGGMAALPLDLDGERGDCRVSGMGRRSRAAGIGGVNG